MMRTMTSFDAVANEYEAGRPGYPDAVYDALEPLAGTLVLEGGAGTGIATRALLRRGARVVPFDVASNALRKAVTHTPGLPAVVADGAAMPFRDRCADLLCFAQSWHWLSEERRCEESARVLRHRGRWAGWWSHARADGEPWFEAYWDEIEGATVARREHRDIDWGEGLRRSPLFDVQERSTFGWVRVVSADKWLLDEKSKSYVADLAQSERESLLAKIRRLVHDRFPNGRMQVPYETWLWVASKV